MELLKEWTNYEQQTKTAGRAARKVARGLEFLHGSAADICADCMPYTSSGSYAAIWNCNAEARKPNTNLYFDGIAIGTNGAPVSIWTERDRDGNEIGTRYEVVE